MDELLKELERTGNLTSSVSFFDVATALFLSFVLSLVIGWVYRATHKGVSYSQQYVHTLVMMGTVVSPRASGVANRRSPQASWHEARWCRAGFSPGANRSTFVARPLAYETIGGLGCAPGGISGELEDSRSRNY